MTAIYSNWGNLWNILGFNFTKRDALSSVYKISMRVFTKNFESSWEITDVSIIFERLQKLCYTQNAYVLKLLVNQESKHFGSNSPLF
jgi:hypothetical protein